MRVLFILWMLVFGFTVTAQEKMLVAAKKNRTIIFPTAKKYFFTINDVSGKPVVLKGQYKIADDTTIVITTRKQTKQVYLTDLLQIYDYRSFANRLGGFLEIGLGSALVYGIVNLNDYNFLNTLYGLLGVAYVTDGVLTLAGVQDIGTLGHKPSVNRGFQFSIKSVH